VLQVVSGHEEQLADVLGEFARTMLTDFPIQGILDRLVTRIVDVLPISAAGVTLISSEEQPHHVAASDRLALRFEQLQSEIAEGPCLMAYRSGRPVAEGDLRVAAARFPRFAPQAVASGLAAVFAFPLRHGDSQLGALDLYRESPGLLSQEAMQAAQTLADVASAYLLNAQARLDLQTTSDRAHNRSLHDDLTGLPNRALLLELLEHAFLRSRRTDAVSAVLFVDLDAFKAVNDRYGHATGDDLLVALAARLSALLRPADTVARLHGDEFVILCEDLHHADEAAVIADRLKRALAEPFELPAGSISVTASVGIAFADLAGAPAEVLRNADAAMYEAKRAGGGRHAFNQLIRPSDASGVSG